MISSTRKKFYKTACSRPRNGTSSSLQGLQSCCCSENWKGLRSAPRCSGLSGHHPSPQGLAPLGHSVQASPPPAVDPVPRCAPPWTFRGSGDVLPQGPRPLGHLPQQHLSCPRGVRGGGPPFPPAPPPPLLQSLPGRRSRGEGEDSAEAPGSQGAAPRGCPAKGRTQTWVTCGDGQGACAFAFRTKIARAAGRRSCGAPFTILMNAAPRHRDAGSPASAGRGGC